MEKQFDHFLGHLEHPKIKKLKKTDWHFLAKLVYSKCFGAKYTNTNTQIHKYTNTVWSDLQIDTTSAIFLKRKWYEDLKNNVPMSLTCKYTIQIHKYTNTNCWEYAFNSFWSKKNNLSSLFGLSNDLGVCSGYVGCTWWSPSTYWWRLLVKICVF